MKNKKGFTLIELLAVIVILAIIALIAVPIILNMINQARKSAAKSSALGYIDSIEAYSGFRSLSEEADLDGYDVDLPEMTNGKVTCTKTSGVWDNTCSAFFAEVDKKNKGKSPDEATIILSESGKVQDGTKMTFNGYEVNYDGQDAYVGNKSNSSSNNNQEQSTGPTKVSPSSSDTHKGIVYMNPKNLTAACSASNSVSSPGTKTGCMKFYIFDDSGDTYKMILDHDTSVSVPYDTSGTYKAYEYSSIKSIVDTDTAGWQGNTRLITANEIATITNASEFNGNSNSWFFFNGAGSNKQTRTSSSQGDNEYAWLFDNTNECTSYGCNVANTTNMSTYGYWTSSPVNGIPANAWMVYNSGRMGYNAVDYVGGDGCVRPVIEISKSLLN